MAVVKTNQTSTMASSAVVMYTPMHSVAEMYLPTLKDVFILVTGIIIGYVMKKVHYYTYSPPNLTHRYTYDEIVEFVGGNPMRKHGALFGTRAAAIVIRTSVSHDDNTIFFEGSFHRGCSPANPGHQSIEFSNNKKMNVHKGKINIFVKVRPNDYAFIGTGLRNGRYFTEERRSRNVIFFPIRYVSGNLTAIIRVLADERRGSSSESSSGSSSS
jgi:hypothetical protein